MQISDRLALVGIRERTSRFIYEAKIVALFARLARVPCEYEHENFDINQQRVATITIIQRVRVPRKLSKRMFNERIIYFLTWHKIRRLLEPW